MVTIQFETDNAAFADGNAHAEIAAILRELADKFEDRRYVTKVYDTNGNVVGSVTWERTDLVR
jgi:hypothetical protein